ncbi:MAG: pilus assembly PilX N-terminal domain-containing protein [Planctomycetota bacterium]|nr:pilus assembly PilX N-terminal domain-containing protein [Planctomycetota bacterium]
MSTACKSKHRAKGTALILSMLFVLVFSALAVSFATLSGANVQVASNQHRVNTSLYAAQSGLDCGRYLVRTVSLDQTNLNYVSDTQAEKVWSDLCAHVAAQGLDGKTVAYDANELTIEGMTLNGSDATFAVRFCRDAADPKTIVLQSTGSHNGATRTVRITMSITKDREILHYAMAGRGRMWLTGDTTIYGDIFSTWNNKYVSPFNTTSETSILGKVNTVIQKDSLGSYHYDLEALDGNGNPLFTFGQTVYDIDGSPLTATVGTIDEDLCLTDTDGNPVFDENGNRIPVDFENRVYSSADELQGYHENVEYYDPTKHSVSMAGLSIADYDTDAYKTGLATIPSSSRTREYFPHAPGNYAQRSSSSSRTLDRHVYQNQTFTNALLPSNRNALFKNCTFEEVLYIDCYKTASTGYNNVRFEDCTFNGVIVTNTPKNLLWQNNALYFTGAATFNNQSSIQEATILAPHFNVDLGNTNPEQSDNNVLTGAIVGGIVDIRGNAQIYGTIISMADTSSWTSGFVTNIGATLDDGGSETTELGDIGVISITPEEDMMLPSGITSPIIIKPDQNTYSESV